MADFKQNQKIYNNKGRWPTAGRTRAADRTAKLKGRLKKNLKYNNIGRWPTAGRTRAADRCARAKLKGKF
jgi:hypothetical protein